MAQGGNGYVTIGVGLLNGGNGGERAAVALASATSTRMSEAERERRMRRLRHEGWSYRRIASTLGVSYAVVCRVLDGDVVTPSGMVVSVPLPPRPVPATSAPGGLASHSLPAMPTVLEDLVVEMRGLRQAVDGVAAQCEAQRGGLARLERTLVSTLQSENRALGQRLLDGVRGLLDRMLPSGRRLGGGDGSGRGGGDG
jgi:hypothetical protein